MGLNPIGVTIIYCRQERKKRYELTKIIRKEKSSKGHGFESHRGHYYLLPSGKKKAT